MKISIELQGLEEVRDLLNENKRLTDELLRNIGKIERTCLHLSAQEKENQPQAGTDG